VAVLQGKAQNFVPELYVVPNSPSLKEEVLRALAKKVATLQGKFPGIAVESQSNDLHVKIPDQYRMGDEQSYARLTQKLLEYVKNSTSPPSYEKPNMLAKYYVTTKGVELGRLGK
jgi:hypothetical protein